MTIEESSAPPMQDATARIQAIHSDFYHITDNEGWPIAALLVLLDSKRSPVRAEIQLYEELEDAAREWAFRQGRRLLESRYYSAEPVPLRVMQSYPMGDPLQVRAHATNLLPAENQWFQRWQVAAGAGVLVLLIALVWALAAFLRGVGSGSNIGAEPPAAQPAGNSSEDAANSNNDQAAPPTLQANLPPSKNADPNLTVGRRVRVRPGLTVSLVAEPGADSTPIGYMQDGQQALIVEGPAMTQGASDTIVWWRVQLDDGSQAWAPANTSEGPVLELVE